jgi:lipid II:glycine glycyltransferase (peptidoglycan interpeptide bridge formation enzyme)
MTLTIKTLDSSNEKAWDDLVISSSHGTMFHTVKWLRLAEEQSHAELLPCMFYKGTQLVAIYPIFIQKQGIIKVALSPPSRSYMLYLGPVIADYTSLKQDKKESIYLQIQEEMDNFIFKIKGCKYARIRSSPGLYDSRPLRWSGYTVDPLYTYRIDLTKGIDYVWEQFEGKLRVKINKSIKEGVTVRLGDKEDLEFVHNLLYNRYTQQGIQPIDYKKYLLDIYQQFHPDNLKIFIAEYKGQRISGTVNLCWKNIMYLWVGVPKTELSGISPNDLINWEAIKWAQMNGLQYYEEMDAGYDPRLRHFKSKYNPDLEIWYSATKHSSFIYKATEKLFNIIRK